MYKILLVEDDAKIREIIRRELEKWDITVTAAGDFSDILGLFLEEKPHLVILDVNLPSRDGFYWCGRIREASSTPVFFISCRDTAMDVVMAVSRGGDDYIAKPFSLEVLTAKVTALLRRAYDYRDDRAETVVRGGACLRLADNTLVSGERAVELTRNEFRILRLLMQNGGAIVSRERIIRELWDDESFIDDNTLTVNVNRLRRRLAEAGLQDFIRTVKNQGYIVP